MSSFCSAKNIRYNKYNNNIRIFCSAKNIRILYIESAKTVNEMTLNELVKLHSFVEIDHEIFSTVILSLPLIQEGQLSVSGERMCTILVNRLED